MPIDQLQNLLIGVCIDKWVLAKIKDYYKDYTSPFLMSSTYYNP